MSRGYGPWDGRYYVNRPPEEMGELHVSEDFIPLPEQHNSLPKYPWNSDSDVCQSARQNVSTGEGSYWEVNPAVKPRIAWR